MTDWSAELRGERADLARLASLILADPMVVERDGGGFVLRSTSFSGLPEPTEVRTRAIQLVEVLNGLARVLDGEARPVEVGVVVGREGSTIRAYVTPEILTIRLGVVVASGQAHGPASEGSIGAWVQLALGDRDVAEALRLLKGTPTPECLHKVWEIIEADAGGRIRADDWASKKQSKRFTHTMNSPAALGLAARHAREHTEPPSKPMTLEEADQFIRGIVVHWLNWKAGRGHE